MIDEAVGKILGMAMAYAVSSLGLWLAYASYRRRVLGAERVMTPRAWAVVAVVVLVVLAAVFVVASLVQPPTATAVEAPLAPPPAPADRAVGAVSAVGLLLPGAVFLVATLVTVALYRHFAARVR